MNKLERQGITRLIDQLGASVLMSRRDYEPLPKPRRIIARHRVAEQIDSCTRCPLHATCRQHILPLWPGGNITQRAQILVVGEAPTEDDDKRGAPYSGRIGKILRNGLVTVGIEPEDCAYTYVISCRPHDEGIWRAPTAYEQGQCSVNLKETIKAADAEYVLLLGAIATRAWRDDVKLTDVAGRLFLWGQQFVYPMFSVQAVLRQTFDANTWREQLGRFAQIVVGNEGTFALSTECIECGEDLHGYDTDGIPWCRTHIADHAMRRETQDRRHAKRAPDQGNLFNKQEQ